MLYVVIAAEFGNLPHAHVGVKKKISCHIDAASYHIFQTGNAECPLVEILKIPIAQMQELCHPAHAPVFLRAADDLLAQQQQVLVMGKQRGGIQLPTTGAQLGKQDVEQGVNDLTAVAGAEIVLPGHEFDQSVNVFPVLHLEGNVQDRQGVHKAFVGFETDPVVAVGIPASFVIDIAARREQYGAAR